MSVLHTLGPLVFIMTGCGSLFIFAIISLGFNFIVKTVVPIAVSSLPLQDNMQIWTSVLLPLSINVSLLEASTKSPSSENGSSLAVGRLEFQLTLSDAEWDPEDYYPILHFQEDGEIGELQRAVQVYTEGPVNYVKTYAALFGVAAFGGAWYLFIVAISLK